MNDRSKQNLFTEQQEEWLGEIMDHDIRANFNIIKDQDDYLQKLGERLLAQLPATKIHYRFTIIDSPELNSFGTTGGRIYIHRRIIAFTQNEDELAGVLGHEIGHVVAKDVIVHISDWFRQLGITNLGDRQDVFNKWNLYQDKQRKVKAHESRSSEEDEQLVADRIGLYAMTRAGYDPNRYADFADRLLQTRGKTGTFWSDIFGITSPQAKRLRQIIKNTVPLEKNCIVPRVADAEVFPRWKQSIIESKVATVQEELPGLVKKVTLQSQLRDDLKYLQFSPDGRYLLAQDGGSIYVLAREPLANLFRINALDAHMAHFTPDSSAIVFYDKELRVERWDVGSQQRTGVHQLTIPDCFESSLSPTGETLACIGADRQFELTIVDVATDKILYNKKEFYLWTYSEARNYFEKEQEGKHQRIFDMKFSPDGRYVAVGHRSAVVAYDLKSREEVHLSARLRDSMRGTFAFVAPGEIVGIDFGSGSQLLHARFPSGEKIEEFKLETDGWLSSTNSSQFMLIRPAGSQPVGILDLKAKKIGLAFKSPAFDIYGDVFAGEQDSGDIALFSSKDNKIIGKVHLPDGPLTSARTAEFSPDGKWLAVSEGTRGSMWNLENGERIFLTRGFDGVHFENGQFIVKFALHVPTPSRVFQMDPVSKETKKLYDVLDTSVHQNQRIFQAGQLLMVVRPEQDKEKNTAFLPNDNFFLEARDIHTNNLLWQRKFHGGETRFTWTAQALTISTSGWDEIKAAVSHDPALSAKLKSMDGKGSVRLLEIFEPAHGEPLGSLLVDTGKKSFDVHSAITVGDSVFLRDAENKRTLVYSLKSGEQKGKLLGHVVTASSKQDEMLMENEDGVADLYRISTLQPMAHFGFPSPIAEANFAFDGGLMVLTLDQTVYQLNPVAGEQTTTTASSN